MLTNNNDVPFYFVSGRVSRQQVAGLSCMVVSFSFVV